MRANSAVEIALFDPERNRFKGPNQHAEPDLDFVVLPQDSYPSVYRIIERLPMTWEDRNDEVVRTRDRVYRNRGRAYRGRPIYELED